MRQISPDKKVNSSFWYRQANFGNGNLFQWYRAGVIGSRVLSGALPAFKKQLKL